MKDFLDRSTWAEMLTNLRQRANLSKSVLAREVGVSIGYISKLETGKTPPPENQRQIFCDVLGLSDQEREVFHIRAEMERCDATGLKYLLRLVKLRKSDDQMEQTPFFPKSPVISGELHAIPIINKAAAGYPQEFTDLDYPVGVADGYISVPDVSDRNAFGFYVAGNSMEPDFPNGTLLIASPNTVPFEGDPCFVRFSPISRVSGCSFKRIYFMKDGKIRLVPINRQYTEEIFDQQELTGIWPVIRAYGKINRASQQQIRRKIQSGGKSETKLNRPTSAAG